MISILLLGFLIGMRHALEADHVAAVATLTVRETSFFKSLGLSLTWGLGHTLILFMLGGLVLLMKGSISNDVAHMLEKIVGVMLVFLGIDVLRRLIKDKVHFHTHKHSDGRVHFHAHSHRGEDLTIHNQSTHDHIHEKAFSLRALFVGMVHGMAGSAALILLALQTINSPLEGLFYIALFGIGSMIGMGLLTAILFIPLRAVRQYTHIYNGLQILVGLLTITLGGATLFA